jgi:hypothetical protein
MLQQCMYTVQFTAMITIGTVVFSGHKYSTVQCSIGEKSKKEIGRRCLQEVSSYKIFIMQG